jgi:hypothetical protein
VAGQSRSSEIRRRRHERQAAGPEADRDRDRDRDDLGRAIHEEIGRLPERHRSAVVLCHLEGLTQREAASRLGWPVGTLQSRLARGRARLRERLERRGLAPGVLVALPPSRAPDALIAATARAASAIHGGRTIGGMIAPTVLAMIETTSKGILMAKLKLGLLPGLLALGLIGSGAALQANRPARAIDGPPTPPPAGQPVPDPQPAPILGSEPTAPPLTEAVGLVPVPAEAGEPGLTDFGAPRPWETVVRVRILFSDKEWGFGSGTVIQSTESEAVILTCAHIFGIKGRPQPSPRDFRTPIRVDLFDGKLTGRQPAMVGGAEKDLPAELIDSDNREDVALLRIRTGRRLPASPVIPPAWPFVKGMKMYALGCSHGNDATAWNTTILDLWVVLKSARSGETTSTIKCTYRPQPGRSGGGLYTTDGYLAGVCSLGDPSEQAGYYAPPGSIHRLLDRNGLPTLYLPSYQGPRVSSNAPASDPVSPPSPGVLPAPNQPLPSANPAAPDDVSIPGLRASGSDQERRLGEVERKLDRILDALKDIKGDLPPTPRR